MENRKKRLSVPEFPTEGDETMKLLVMSCISTVNTVEVRVSRMCISYLFTCICISRLIDMNILVYINIHAYISRYQVNGGVFHEYMSAGRPFDGARKY